MCLKLHPSIDLFVQNRPVFVTASGALTYENGRKQAQSWADCLMVDFEHAPFDTLGLQEFIKGLIDGGPTPTGYRMPTVVATVPANCRTRVEVESNAWQIRHVLSSGVHGVLHTHAREADAVSAFVEACRYPFQDVSGVSTLGEGQRGAGGQDRPAALWGMTSAEYLKAADPWPLNPEGQLLLGIKLEDRHCLANVDAITQVAGIAFAEWGPGDMGMSFGQPESHDPPYGAEMEEARKRVKSACDKNGIRFLSSWNDAQQDAATNLTTLLKWGVDMVVSDTSDLKQAALTEGQREI